MASAAQADAPPTQVHSVAAQKQSSTSRTRYLVQRVYLGPRSVSVCLENAAGCSALLSVVNSLLLRGAISIPSRITNVSDTDLVNSITAYMVRVSGERLATNQPASQDVILRTQANLADAIAALPTLKESLEVKCKFDSIDSFGLSRELNVFDLCRTTLLHGRVVDPRDEELYAAVAHHTQNELEDMLISADTSEMNEEGTFDEHASTVADNNERRPASHRSYVQEVRASRADDSDYSADTDEAASIVRKMNGPGNMPRDASHGKFCRSNTDTLRHPREKLHSSTGSVNRVHSLPYRSRRSPRNVRDHGSEGGGSGLHKRGVFRNVGDAIRSLPFFARSKGDQGGPHGSLSAHSIGHRDDVMRRPGRATRKGSDLVTSASSTSPADYAESWLGKHKGNLSPEGLRQLESRMSRGEFAILSLGQSFRTILKAEADGHIYALVSDLKTMGHPQAVFELLTPNDLDPPKYCSGADIYRPTENSTKKGRPSPSATRDHELRRTSRDTKRLDGREGTRKNIPSPVLPQILKRSDSQNSGHRRRLGRTNSTDSSPRRRREAGERYGALLRMQSSSAWNSKKMPTAKWFYQPRAGMDTVRPGGAAKPRQTQNKMPSQNKRSVQNELPSQTKGGPRLGESSRSLREKLSRALEVIQTTPVRQDFYGDRQREC